MAVARKSPAANAAETEPGTEALGSDGNFWIAKALKNGTRRWFPYRAKGEKEQKYRTLDNGGQPFEVRYTQSMVNVFVWQAQDEYQFSLSLAPYTNIFVGKDSAKGKKNQDGNTILVELKKGLYVFIGTKIVEFKTQDAITELRSMVGNSAVPYPYALGADNVYYPEENMYIPNEDITSPDPHGQCYDETDEFIAAHRMNVKVLHPRLWE